LAIDELAELHPTPLLDGLPPFQSTQRSTGLSRAPVYVALPFKNGRENFPLFPDLSHSYCAFFFRSEGFKDLLIFFFSSVSRRDGTLFLFFSTSGGSAQTFPGIRVYLLPPPPPSKHADPLIRFFSSGIFQICPSLSQNRLSPVEVYVNSPSFWQMAFPRCPLSACVVARRNNNPFFLPLLCLELDFFSSNASLTSLRA